MVEILIAIMVVTVVAGLAMPAISGTNQYIDRCNLDNAARILASDLRLLQQMAVNSGGGTMPELSFTSCGYKIKRGEKEEKTVTFPENVKVNDTDIFSFDINGRPPRNFGSTITLSDVNNKLEDRKVIISSQGRIRVEVVQQN